MAFATYEDLESRLGITLSEAEQTRATDLLGKASNLVKQATGQTIEEVTDDVYVIRGTYNDSIRLPQKPASSVASISFRDPRTEIPAVEVPENDYYLDGEFIRRYGSWGWYGPDYEVTVVYTHGYAEDAIPEFLKAIVVETVVRVWVNPGNVASEGHGSESVSYGATSRGLLLTPEDIKDLKDHFGAPRAYTLTLS